MCGHMLAHSILVPRSSGKASDEKTTPLHSSRAQPSPWKAIKSAVVGMSIESDLVTKGDFSHQSLPQRLTKWPQSSYPDWRLNERPYPLSIITLTCLKSIPLIIKCTSYKRVARLIDRIPRSQPSSTVRFTQSKPEQEAFLLIYQKGIKTGLSWLRTLKVPLFAYPL